MALREDDITYFENAAERFADPKFDLARALSRILGQGEPELWSAQEVRKFWSQWSREVGEGTAPGLLNLTVHAGPGGEADLDAEAAYFAGFIKGIPMKTLRFEGSVPEAVRKSLRDRFAPELVAGPVDASDDASRGYSVLGIGPGARSYLFGRCLYSRGSGDAAFDPKRFSYTGRRMTIRDEMLKHLYAELASGTGIRSAAFKEKFGREIGAEFQDALANGRARGLLSSGEDGTFRLKSGAPREAFLCGLYLAGREAVSRALGEDLNREAVSNEVLNLELNVGMACNNHCTFCISGEVENSMRMWMPLETAQRELLHFYNQGVRSVGFLGGEPSAYPHILDSLRYAKTLGYRRIALCSNGTKYSDPKFVGALLSAGVTRFTISIHSHVPEIEDRLTELPGNFAHKIKGLRHLRRLRLAGRLPDNVALNPVLNTHTVPLMAGYVEFFRNEGFDDIRFNYIWPQSRVENDKSFIPTYRGAMPEILKIILLNESRWKMHLSFGGVPPCMLRWGCRDLSADLLDYIATRYLLELEDLPTQTSLQGRERFDWNTFKGRKRTMLKLHKEECAGCPYFMACEGVWKTYANMYGIDEIVALEKGKGVSAQT